MTFRRGFFCVGCWTVDRIKQVDTWPVEETLATIITTDRQGGGSAHNLAVDIRQLDSTMPVYAAGVLGQDDDGDFIATLAKQAGVEAAQLHRCADASTSFTDVMTVQSTGKRTFFHHTGSNDWLLPTHIDFNKNAARIAHFGLLGLHSRMDSAMGDTTAEKPLGVEVVDQPVADSTANGWVIALRAARAAGLHTNIELVSIAAEAVRQIATPCLAHLNSLIVNDYEIGCLAGIQTVREGVAMPQQCIAAAQQVHAMSSADLVVVHYPTGASCVTSDGVVISLPSCELPDRYIVSSVGAGDAFAAGFLYALHEGWALVDALRLAHGAAALSLRCATATGGVQTVNSCLDFALQHGLSGVATL